MYTISVLTIAHYETEVGDGKLNRVVNSLYYINIWIAMW